MKYSNEQIRGAILRAADRVEQEPHTYSFNSIETPLGDKNRGGCGTRFCMLGWIGFELNSQAELSHAVASCLFGKGEKFCGNYEASEMYDFCMTHLRSIGMASSSFQADAKVAALCMRAYADKYFPAEVARPVAEDRQLVRWDQCAWQPKAVA